MTEPNKPVASDLIIDLSALKFYFDAMLPEVSEITRAGMVAAITRGIQAREQEAERRGISAGGIAELRHIRDNTDWGTDEIFCDWLNERIGLAEHELTQSD